MAGRMPAGSLVAASLLDCDGKLWFDVSADLSRRAADLIAAAHDGRAEE